MSIQEGRPASGRGLRGQTIRVVVAADSQVRLCVLRDALAGAADVEVVGYALGLDGLTQLAATAAPDVVVVDEPVFRAWADLPTPRPGASPHLVLPAATDPEGVRALLAAGVSAVLSRTASPVALLGAIRALAAGGALAAPDPGGGTHLPGDLTARELEVLQGVVLAWSNVEIADALSVSAETVKTHVSTLLRKLACRNRVDLALHAYQAGLGARSPDRGRSSPHLGDGVPYGLSYFRP